MLETKQLSSTFFKSRYHLPIIDLGKQEDILTALQRHRGFIINLEGSCHDIVTELFKAYHQFLCLPSSEKLAYKGDESGICGFYDNPYSNGNKLGDPRFYIKRVGKSVNQPLPTNVNGHNIQELNERLYGYLSSIIETVIHAIYQGLKLPANEHKEMLNFNTVTTLHHHTPVTKEKLSQWAKDGQLTKTENNQLETMTTHKDFSAFTILIYNNNISSGLEVKAKHKATQSTYIPINLAENQSGSMQAVILLGRLIEYLTPSLKGLSHRVVAKALSFNQLYSRDVINCFVTCEDSMPLQYCPLKDSCKITSLQEFFAKCTTLYQSRKGEQIVTDLSLKDLVSFPDTQEDIQKELLPAGIVYKRK